MAKWIWHLRSGGGVTAEEASQTSLAGQQQTLDKNPEVDSQSGGVGQA